ncbi:hypothetical protein PLESTB_001193300 [Pleodorina starrii]|uniref:Ribosome maturation SBDS n=1 Tax=Pleodorina starrii TaxID=330485 RepID=A0A9W6BSL2_9CHLO|nr:hypothetical protein PLESTM_001830600 [Pleodorina starrii]GLC57155.1 hypothetical protein PLESTB_001193300 [Pleodorina starrii]GLC71462.1 hypothetical protein PLESTF_001118500 [Pleodorina starrii]
MSRVFQPVGQKRLTNIAVVRLKKNGERFEIACYKNKVGDWRSGIEKDLDEVLQTTTIFHNVGKGVVAKDKELLAAFGSTDQKTICLEILAKGELQVSDKERKLEYEHLFKDVAGVLVEKCVNPATHRPYTLSMLERALRDIHFNLDPKKSAKQQALEALPLLQKEFPIERARMHLKLCVGVEAQQELEQLLQREAAEVESIDVGAGGVCTVVAQVEPGAFRNLHNFVQTSARGSGRLEVLSLAVMAGGATLEEFANWGAQPVAVAVPAAVSLGGRPASGGEAAAAAESNGGASGPYATAAEGQRRASGAAASGSGRTGQAAAAAAGAAGTGGRRGGGEADGGGAGAAGVQAVVYPRGPVRELPEEHSSRRERFAELDTLQPGWTVELRTKGDTVEAVFFHPSGERVGAFANARRMALQASKATA